MVTIDYHHPQTMGFGYRLRKRSRAAEISDADGDLEFSDYGRDSRFPSGTWLLVGFAMGTLCWAVFLLALFS